MTDIFDHVDTSPSIEDIQNYKDLLVGDGRKFKDEEALARGKYESDKFVEKLQGELSGLRQELNSRLTMEELLSKLGKQNASTPIPTSVEPERLPVQGQGTPNITPEQIAALVKNTMQEENTKTSQSQNLDYASQELKKFYGDGWQDKLLATGTTLGLSKDYIDNLAKTAPKALMAIVNAQRPTSVSNDQFGAPRSTVAFAPSSQSTMDQGWQNYEKLKKDNPKLYWSPRVQTQLHKDVMSGKVKLPA